MLAVNLLTSRSQEGVETHWPAGNMEALVLDCKQVRNRLSPSHCRQYHPGIS